MNKLEIRLAKLALQKGADEERKINISVVARETGLTRNTVADYWYDRVKSMNRDVLATLIDWLGCSLDDLVVEVEYRDENPESKRVPLPFTLAS